MRSYKRGRPSQDFSSGKIPCFCLTSLSPCSSSTVPTGLHACSIQRQPAHEVATSLAPWKSQQDLCQNHLKVLVTLFPLGSCILNAKNSASVVNLTTLFCGSRWEQELGRRKSPAGIPETWLVQVPCVLPL